MARVLTDNKYYSQIADVIREQNGTSNTYKPQQIVSALKDLFYEEVEGVPPISFNGIGENLLDYRIDGASGGVGEMSENLFNINSPNVEKGCYYDRTGVKQKNFRHDSSEYIPCRSGVTYTLSFYSKKQYYGVFVNLWDLQKQFVSNLYDSGTINKANDTINCIFTPNQDGYIKFNLLYDSGYMDNIMLNEGSTALPYEPYGYKVPVIVEGKNLLQNTAISQTINGVIFTVNGDGSVDYERISTAERDSDLYLIGTLNSTEVTELKPNTNYIFSGGANSKAYVRVVGFGISGGLDVVADNSTRITYNEGKILLRVRVTETGSGTFYPMIRLASVTDDTYEPYHEPTTTNIYLDEPIEENESISLSDTNVDIPTIRGTNVLTVDTTVQPNNVYVKARKESQYETIMRERYEEAQAQLDALESE